MFTQTVIIPWQCQRDLSDFFHHNQENSFKSPELESLVSLLIIHLVLILLNILVTAVQLALDQKDKESVR